MRQQGHDRRGRLGVCCSGRTRQLRRLVPAHPDGSSVDGRLLSDGQSSARPLRTYAGAVAASRGATLARHARVLPSGHCPARSRTGQARERQDLNLRLDLGPVRVSIWGANNLSLSPSSRSGGLSCHRHPPHPQSPAHPSAAGLCPGGLRRHTWAQRARGPCAGAHLVAMAGTQPVVVVVVVAGWLARLLVRTSGVEHVHRRPR